jgi:hypothetical protein
MNQQGLDQERLKLKQYFQIGIGVGVLVALVSGFVWFRSHKPAPPAENVEVTDVPEDTGLDARFDDELQAKVGLETAPTPERKKSEPVDMNKASEFFGQSMKQMAACVGLNTSGVGGERLDPSFESLLTTVKSDLGDPILRSEDWMTWNMRASGEERRIRIETDYSDSDQASRHLLYFKLGKDGQPTLIPLPNEQTKDPSESFIASLQKDGEVYEEEKGERAYFENGQEMVLTEKNGKIDDLEFSNGSKTFRCAGILTSSPSCKCY